MSDEEILAYIDSNVNHAIENIEYGNFFSDEILGFVDTAIEECWNLVREYKRAGTKKRATELMSAIRSVLSKMKKNIDNFIATELPKVIDEEEEWLDEIGTIIGVNFDYSSKGLDMLGIIPIAAAGSTLMYGKSVFDNLEKTYNSVITQGLITGSNYEDFIDDYTSQMNSIRRGIEADSETIGESLGSQYDRIVYTYNKEKLNKFRWSSRLDSSTCLVCGMQDGTIYDDITKVGIYPLHDRCRCRLEIVPEGVNPDDMRESYKHWFERQNDDVKRKVLQATRFKMYKNGTNLEQFVNNGKKIPLGKKESPTEKLVKETKELMKEKFPKETWTKVYENVYVSEGRLKTANINSVEMKKYQKELTHAEILSRNQIVSFLPPELGKGKHFDAYSNLVETEFKMVTGNRSKIGDNFSKALKQGHNIFIRTPEEPASSAYSSILGKVKVLLENNIEIESGRIVYYWNDKQQVLHKWDLDKIISEVKLKL